MTPQHFYASIRLGPVMIALTMLAGWLAPAVAAAPWTPPRTVWVEEAGHTVDGYFLDDWRAHRALFGLPITEEFETPVTVAGRPEKARTVQYFENVAIAYVPEDPRREWQVQALPLGKAAFERDRTRLARLKLPDRGTCSDLSRDVCLEFAVTGHTLRLGFKAFWEANNGDRLIGPPLTEEFIAPDGYTTQYFERMVLRWKSGEDVTVRALGQETARRLKLDTSPIPQPVGVPVYSESLFVPPVGGDLGFGPGPQQGGFKEIVVSISRQAMWAYEDGELVIASLVSTGVGNVPETVTPVGYFSVLVKFETETMEGTISDEYYRVEDVPHVMYFDNLGNALHGTYWHNNFGTPMSHGCVNLPMDVAEFIYHWAPIGTKVVIHS